MAIKVKEEVSVVKFPMYSFDVHLIVTESINKSRRKRNKILGKVPKDFIASGLYSHITNWEGYIFLTNNTSIEVLSHECFHAIVHMMTGIDTKLHDRTEETFAYPLGYLVEKAHNFVESVKPNFIKNDNTKSKRSREITDKIQDKQVS